MRHGICKRNNSKSLASSTLYQKMEVHYLYIVYSILLVFTRIPLTLGIGCSISDPCNNGGTCDASGSCVCDALYVGDCCQYEITNLAQDNSASCMAASSPELSADFSCAHAIDAEVAPGARQEWVSQGDGVGAFIIIDLGVQQTVLGVKFLQRCDPQNQAKKLVVSLSDGSVQFLTLACSQTSVCEDQHWESFMFPDTRSDIELVKITVMETCGTDRSDVGFRELVITGPIDECTTLSPCLHGATCVEQDLGYSCQCANGFEGENCQINIDDCVGVVCENGGTCEDQVAAWTCQCADGFEGTNCETNTDDCAGVTCANGGSCVDEVAGFSCVCPDGEVRESCEAQGTPCDPDPCMNDGECAETDGADGFTCNCVAGFTGDLCETNIDDCEGVTCYNHGSCLDLTNSFKCLCNPLYTGKHCQLDLRCVDVKKMYRKRCAEERIQSEEACLEKGCCWDTKKKRTLFCFKVPEPCGMITCQHGGTCVNAEDGKYSCMCAAPWTGTHCENNPIEATTCHVGLKLRTNCGFRGIKRAACEARGCCFDDVKKHVQCYFNELAP